MTGTSIVGKSNSKLPFCVVSDENKLVYCKLRQNKVKIFTFYASDDVNEFIFKCVKL